MTTHTHLLSKETCQIFEWQDLQKDPQTELTQGTLTLVLILGASSLSAGDPNQLQLVIGAQTNRKVEGQDSQIW